MAHELLPNISSHMYTKNVYQGTSTVHYVKPTRLLSMQCITLVDSSLRILVTTVLFPEIH